MRRTLLALGGVAILVTACGSSHRAAAPTTTSPFTSGSVGSTTVPSTTLPSTTVPSITIPAVTTTTVPNTSIVPGTITVAYVNAVLVQLNHVYGDAVRASVKGDKLTPRAVEYLNAIYNQRLETAEKGDFAETLSGGLQNVRRVPGDPITSVQKLIYTSASCIYARVQTDSNPIVIHPVTPLASEFMGLKRPAITVARGLNPTPWILFYDGVTKTPSNIPDQCPAS